MKLQVLHQTHFAYAVPVRDSFNEARLQPADHSGQRRQSFLLKVLPSTKLTHYRDLYRNCVHLFELSSPHSELTVEAVSTVTTAAPPTLSDDDRSVSLREIESCRTLNDCYDFLQGSAYVELDPATWRLALDVVDDETDTWQATLKLMRFIHREFRYQPASTTVHTTSREALKLRAGVCQDFAHVMLGMCRVLNIPARYVSGYLYNGPTEHLKGAQASHAWVEVFIPGPGWLGLDPTNNQAVNDHYVMIGVGRDYADVPPLKGTYRGTAQRRLTVSVLVKRLDEGPPPAESQRAETRDGEVQEMRP